MANQNIGGYDRQFQYSEIKTAYDNAPVRIQSTWGAFAKSLQNPVERGKLALKKYLNADKEIKDKQKNGKAWHPAVFKRDSKRHEENVIALHSFVADVDGKKIQTVNFKNEFTEKLSKYAYAYHTSYSHSLEQEKWRVIIPFSEAVPQKKWPEVYAYFQKIFGDKIDPACNYPTCLFYLPSYPPGGKDLFQAGDHLGDLFNPSVIWESSKGAKPAQVKADTKIKKAGKVDLNKLNLKPEILEVIKEGKPEGTRSEALFSVILSMLHKGISDGKILSVIMDPDNKISEKPIAQGDKWAESELKRARAKHKEGGADILAEVKKAEKLNIDAVREELKKAVDAKIGPLKIKEILNSLKDKSGCALRDLQAELTKIKVESANVDLANSKGSALVVINGDGSRGLVPQSTAGDILCKTELLKNLVFDDVAEEWYKYLNNVWIKGTNIRASAHITNGIKAESGGLGFSAGYAAGVATFIKGVRISPGKWNPNPDLIPFSNGVLDLKTRVLVEHKPEQYFTWILPYAYNPAAQCQTIKAWLLETVGGDKDQVEVMRAYMRALIVGAAYLHRYLEIIGPGGTGKSTFANLCQTLVGVTNVFSTELKRLAGNNSRFETANIYQKKLVLISDAEKFAGDVSTLKNMTGGDPLPYEVKHKQGGKPNFVYKGLVLIAANEPIQSADYTSGLQRRRLTMTFTHQVAPENRRDLASEFEPELPGLVNWVLAMPEQRMEELLRDTNRHVKSLENSYFNNLVATNPIAAWIHEWVVLDPKSEVKIGSFKEETITKREFEDKSITRKKILFSDSQLYPSYRAFCQRNGLSSAVALRRFGGLFADMLHNQLKLRDVEKFRTEKGYFWKGLALRSGCGVDPRKSPIPLDSSDENEQTSSENEQTSSENEQSMNNQVIDSEQNEQNEQLNKLQNFGEHTISDPPPTSEHRTHEQTSVCSENTESLKDCSFCSSCSESNSYLFMDCSGNEQLTEPQVAQVRDIIETNKIVPTFVPNTERFNHKISFLGIDWRFQWDGNHLLLWIDDASKLNGAPINEGFHYLTFGDTTVYGPAIVQEGVA